MYPLTVRDILSQFRTSSNLVQYTRELSFTNAAAPQAGENVAKAESQMTFELKNAPVQTLAHWIAASRQVLTDRTTQSSDRFEVRAGHATRRHRVVKSFGADDLVFQSVWKGRPMLDGNILKRFIHPAAKKLGIYVNWLCLRTSYATWLVYAGADPKSVQGQMRHSRISTTMDIYAQIVPAGQRRAVDKLSEYVNEASESAVRKPVPLLFQ